MQMEDFHDTDEMDMSDDSQDLPRNNKRFKSDIQYSQVRKLQYQALIFKNYLSKIISKIC